MKLDILLAAIVLLLGLSGAWYCFHNIETIHNPLNAWLGAGISLVVVFAAFTYLVESAVIRRNRRKGMR